MRKEFFCEMFLWTHRKQFWQLRRNCLGTNWIFFARCSKRFRKVHTFQKEIFFFKKLRWTRNIQFWQPQRNVFGWRPEIFHSISEKVMIFFTFFSVKYFSSIYSYRNIKSSFGSPTENFSEQTKLFLLDVQTCFEKYTFFKGIFFQNVAMDTGNPILTAPTKCFLQKAKTFLLIFRKRYKVF